MLFQQEKKIPLGHDWLIKRMQAVDYEANDSGVCKGVAYVCALSHLADQLKELKKTIEVMNLIPLDKFDEFMETSKKLIMQYSVSSSSEIKNKMEKDLKLTTSLDNYVAKLDIEEKKVFFNNLLLKINDRIKEKLKKFEVSNPKIYYALEILALMEQIEIGFQWQIYAELFAKKTWVDLLKDHKSMLDLIMPRKLEKQGGVISTDRFYSIYTLAELTDYFKLMQDELSLQEPPHYPIAIVLRSSDHAITVGLSPREVELEGVKKIIYDFTFAEVNRLNELDAIWNHKEVAKKVHTSFSKNKFAELESEIFCSKTNGDKLLRCMQRLKENETWKDLHATARLTKDKAQRVSSKQGTLLNIAAINGDIELVKKLVNYGANVNIVDAQGGALFRAAEYGYHNIVECLLMSGANPNNAANDGTTPLAIAVQNGHVDVVQTLLNYKADPNKTDTDGRGPLYVAVKDNDVQMVKILLKNNPHCDQALVTTETPLFIAAQLGYADMVALLISSGANQDLGFTTTKEKLGDFATENECEKNMRDFFIKAKLLDKPDSHLITLSPLDIATILNHTQVINILESDVSLSLIKSISRS